MSTKKTHKKIIGRIKILYQAPFKCLKELAGSRTPKLEDTCKNQESYSHLHNTWKRVSHHMVEYGSKKSQHMLGSPQIESLLPVF
jgi:hypothetical protein